MSFYHGSPTGGLQILQPAASPLSNGRAAVWMSALPVVALFYGIRHFEYTYGFTFVEGSPKKPHYMECFPGALRELYGGREGWLYRCEDGDYLLGGNPFEYQSPLPVRTAECLCIPDLYQALLARERAGELEIIAYGALSPAMRQRIRRWAAETILNQGLLDTQNPLSQYMREKYPHSWEDAEKNR